MKMRRFGLYFFLCFFSGLVLSAPLAAPEKNPVVLELFTSQGCSSCPPADALLRDYVKEDGVIALSFNVDYWDYLGWKDTLASPANTERQSAYSRFAGRRGIYTPELMVAGRWSVIGSDRRAVREAIQRARQTAGPKVAIDTARDQGKIVVKIDGPSDLGEAIIWLVRFDKKHSIKIKRGENRGREITYHNVVRDFHSLGMWQGKPMEIALMHDQLTRDGADGCAIIVQQKRFGPIVGAAEVRF